MSSFDDISDIAAARPPRRSGREPFALREFPLMGLLAAIDWLEEEMLRFADGTRDPSGRRFLALVRRLVRVDGLYWRLRDFNRVVRAKRAVLADAKAKAGLLAELGGEAACERWERRAAGLRRKVRATKPDWYWARRARERARKRAVGQGRVRGQGRKGDMFRLAALPLGTRKAYAVRSAAQEPAGRAGGAPIPVWPCEVMDADAHAAMMVRVRAAVAEKDRELAAMRAAKARGRKARASRMDRIGAAHPRGVGGLRETRPLADGTGVGAGGEGRRAWSPP